MRTRFAPSPTGMLHVGGLRTALYAYIAAKQSGGKFLLRIEDTDQGRSIEGALENILSTLHWAGLDPDEGVMMRDNVTVQEGAKGPYIQSERIDVYQQYIKQLLESGHAYYAFDTKEEIERMRNEQTAAGVAAPKYDSSVRMRMRNALTMSETEVQEALATGKDVVVRLKVPEGHTISFVDDIRGKVETRSLDIDDAVLLKSDGFPTYHLANVVDDHLMDIGIVIRGEEWLPSLPKHLLLYEALGWQPPRFAHVPLLLNKDKSKLSKRQNDVSADDYREKGYLPEVMINFLALLGWNPGTTQEIFTLQELIDAFSIERIQKAGAVFDVEKLDWLQGQWVRALSKDDFAKRIQSLVSSHYPAAADDSAFEQRASLIQERLTFFSEAPEMLSYFYKEPTVTMEILANKKQKVTEELAPEILTALIEVLDTLSQDKWNEEAIKTALEQLAEEKTWKRGQVLWPLRAALTGLPYSPGAYELAAELGKETTMKRLHTASVA